jgi:hypothetical protein
VLAQRGFCFSAFSVFQFSGLLHGIHLSRRYFLRHLPGAPESVQHEAADGGLPPTGRHSYLFRFFHGTSQKNRASGSRRTEGCARRCLIEFTKSRKPREQYFFHVQSRSQPRQDVGADGSPIALGAVANCGGFVCGTADQEGGSLAHGAMISSDITSCNATTQGVTLPAEHSSSTEGGGLRPTPAWSYCHEPFE